MGFARRGQGEWMILITETTTKVDFAKWEALEAGCKVCTWDVVQVRLPVR